MIEFAYPYALGMLVLPFVAYFLLPQLKGMHGDALKVPFVADLKRIEIKSGIMWRGDELKNIHFSRKFWLVYGIWGLLCVAAMRPQIVGNPVKMENEGRDIMLVLDISTSMLEPDFDYQGRRATRLDAVKRVVADFVEKRKADRMGLILFGTRAYLQAPLTYDKTALKDILFSMKAGMAGDSTSIGDALALALKNMLNTKKKRSQVIVLLTDGENNDGSLSMAQAIKLAAMEKIKVYTIGVGSPNLFFKMLSSVGLQGLDESELNTLADVTKGQYFRASKTDELRKIYDLIDELETSTDEERYVRDIEELYYVPLFLAWVWAFSLIVVWRLRRHK